jgi:hypothetical protein
MLIGGVFETTQWKSIFVRAGFSPSFVFLSGVSIILPFCFQH